MSGSTGIDEGQEFAKPLISESLRMRRAIFIEGGAGKKVVLDVIKEEDLIVDYLTDEMIAERVPGFGNLRAKVGRSDHLAMLVSDAERTQSCYVFTCMQFASAVGGPQSAHRSGNFAIQFFTIGFVHSLFLQMRQDITSFRPTQLSKSRCSTVFFSRLERPRSQLCCVKMD